MSEQRILTDAERNEECRQAEAERHPVLECCCANGGKPYLLDGVLVVSRNAGCRVHHPTPGVYMPAEEYPPDYLALMKYRKQIWPATPTRPTPRAAGRG